MADSTLAPIAQPPSPEGAGRDPRRQDQAAARLQGRAVGARHQQRARDDLGRQGHAVRQQPRGRQCLRGGGQGRPARGEGDRQGPQPAQRRGLQGRHALHRGDLADHARCRASRTSSTIRPPWKWSTTSCPRDLPHGWKYLAFGPDGKLYFNIGAPCNICIPPDTHANISRVNPDGSGFEYVAHGVRNSVGFDWHPVTKELYFATHARDWMGEDVPSDRFDVAPKKGLHFGFPYCHQGDILDPEFGKGHSLRGVRAAAHQDRPARGRQRRRVLHGLDVPARVQEPRLPRPARLVEPHQEDRLPRDDGHAAPRRRAEVRGLRRGLARTARTSGAGPSTPSR